MSNSNELLNSQAKLIAAILDNGEQTNPGEDAGLAAYRRGLKANANRALEISYPTICQLLGEDFFSQTATRYLSEYPFCEGDWGAWGEQFPEWLSRSPEIEQYPYLTDSARLDWACHQAGRAKTEPLDLTSLQLLAEADPYRLRFRLAASLSLVASDYPVVAIWQAHQNEDERQDRLDQARKKLYERSGEIALVWRKDWKAEVRALEMPENEWFELLFENRPIGEALDRVQGKGFSLETWLPSALEQKLIIGIEDVK